MTESQACRGPEMCLPELRSPVTRYAVAVSAAIVAVGVWSVLHRSLSLDHGAYVMSTVAVLVSAAFGGLKAGLLTTALLQLAVIFLWLPAVRGSLQLRWDDFLLIGVFLTAGWMISWMAEQLWRMVRRAEAVAQSAAEANDRLRLSEERFRRMFEEGPLGIMIVCRDHRVSVANPMLCRMLGYDTRELVGRSIESLTDPADVAAEASLLQRVWDGLLPGFTITKRFIRKGGKPFWATLSVSPVRDSHGLPVCALGMAQDITERKRLDEALRRSKEEAEAASKAKDQFLAVLSHELRTPLSPVLLTASTLEGDASLPADVRESMQIIRQNVELEARLIDDLLDLTGIARGKLKLHKVRADTHALLGQAIYMVERDVNEKRLRIRVRLDAQHAEVDGDPARLEQVFWNLIKNAVKFTPAGGEVAVRTRNEGGAPAGAPEWFVAEVTDTGVGIPAEALSRVFRAFEQGSAGVTHRFGGLGLGLAISRSIVEMHGGWIRAASEGPGKGATFTLGIPLATASAGASEIPPPPGAWRPDGQRQPQPPSPMRVLLVEDHPATRRAMVAILQSLGHEVHSASTLADALRIDETGRFDVVMSDLALPDGSGHDLMRQLKAKHPLHGVAVSGYGMEDDIRRSREAGFDEHLTKPVSRDKIRQALSHVRE